MGYSAYAYESDAVKIHWNGALIHDFLKPHNKGNLY